MDPIQNEARDGVSGRGVGVCMLAVFGMLWLYYALMLGGAPGWKLYAALAVTAALVLAGILRIVSDKKSAVAPQTRAPRLFFFLVFALEIAVIFAAVQLLQYFHLAKYVVPTISTIVGLHFFPLAKLLGAPIYYATGLALVLGTLLAAVLWHGLQQVIHICYGAAAIFWLTAFIVAVRRA